MRSPVDAQFDLGCGTGVRVSDLEPGEAGIAERHGDVESVGLERVDRRGERFGELVLGCCGGEQVDVFGGAIDETVSCTAYPPARQKP
jgi:hypothetical protein